MAASTIWTMGENTFTWHDQWNNGVTHFADGRELVAAPNDDDGSRFQAFLMGYGQSADELARMCREHEMLHTWLAVRAGLPHSPTLYSVALMNEGEAEDSPLIEPLHLRLAEEERVMDLQKRVNTTMDDGDLVVAAREFLGSGKDAK